MPQDPTTAHRQPPQPSDKQSPPGQTSEMTVKPDHGEQTPLGRAGQPAERAPAYVLLASGEASYISGAMLPVTGGRPML